jgi:hypothetical protein
VLVIDDLDKLVTRPLEDMACAHDEHLFIHREPQLTALRCHVVYTVPLELAYSHHGPVLRERYGGYLPVIPMICVRGRPGSPNAERHGQEGVGLMRRMVEQRLADADLAESDVFAPAMLNRLIAFSGGQPHVLMSGVQEAALIAGLPIGEEGLHRIEVELRRTYARMLRAEWALLLDEVMEKGELTLAAATDQHRRELLSSRALLLYMNDTEWYGLNPALEGIALPRPRSAEP